MFLINFQLWARNRNIPGGAVSILGGGGLLNVGSDYKSMYVPMYVCVSVNMCMCTYMCMYMHVYMCKVYMCIYSCRSI